MNITQNTISTHTKKTQRPKNVMDEKEKRLRKKNWRRRSENKIKRNEVADVELMVVVKSARRRYTQMIWKMYKM